MTARAAILIAIASCGDNASAVDAGLVDASVRCTATFTGNFAEISSSDRCAVGVLGAVIPGHTTLELTIPSTSLGASLTAQIDLGVSPSLGPYSSRTVATWNARGVQTVGNGVCLYSAGATAVPPGTFELALDAIEPIDATTRTVHGSFKITMFVLAFPSTECGERDTEMVEVGF